MKHQNLPLLLEQLEDRIFLDANPLIVADGGVDPTVDPVVEAPVELAVETVATEPEKDEQQTESDVVAVETSSADDTESEDISEQEDAVVALEVSNSDESQTTEIETQAEQQSDTTEETPVISEIDDESEESDNSIKQVVFVDNSVADYNTLLDGIMADISVEPSSSNDAQNEEADSDQLYNGIQIITLDASQDEIQQITDALSGYSNLEGVHIISHGANSSIRLGETTLDSENLDDYSSQLSQWGEALSEDGDLLLYGCNVAEDGSGAEFIEAVSVLTGADVAASDDATGNASSGGDWDLEVATGEIDVAVLQDATGEWDGLLAVDPTSLSEATDTNPMVNSQFGFTVSFDNDTTDNVGTDTGYGPFLDVFIPHEIEIVGSPTIFGNTISPPVFTWNGSDWEDETGTVITTHPGNSDTNPDGTDLTLPAGSFDVGDKWYFIEQPFGSFTTGQPAIGVDFTAIASISEGAEVGVDYDILHRAGFSFGDTATNDNGPMQEAAVGTLTITPQVIDIEKINDVIEAQTVTGPNYPVEYTLTVNIAAGETVDNVIVQDYLPGNAVYRGDVTITAVAGSGAADIVGPVITQPVSWTVLGSDADDRLLQLELGSLTGAASPDSGHTEWEIKYTVYFSDVDVDGNALLPGTGDDVTVRNESSITGNYNGVDVSDGVGGDDNATESDNELQIASIVTSKAVIVVGGGAPVPGAVLEYTIEVDISDYYSAAGIVLNDIFGDGQTFVGGFTPTLVVHENGSTTSTTFDAANYTVGVEDAYDDIGSTEVIFRVSDQLGPLEGGFIADGVVIGADADGDTLNGRIGGDGTHAFITFRTVIDEDFDEFQDSVQGSGDSSVDMGDSINNDVAVTASIDDNNPATNPEQQTDSSAAGVTIEGGDVLKEIYAVNGVIGADLSDGVTSGDEITYRLRLELPLADFEDLVITDYLPLPVYDVTELDPADQANDFDGIINLVAGEVEFGPDHTLDGNNIAGLAHNGVPVTNEPLVPVVSFDTSNNAVSFDFGSYDADGAQVVVVDVLLTVTIQNEAMVDGLQLTNQGEWSFNNTTSEVTEDDAIVQITLNEPVVTIVKGVVHTDNVNSNLVGDQGPGNPDLVFNPDGTVTIGGDGSINAQDLVDSPVDSNLLNADGSDLVTFAITVYNTGGADAFDIHVSDTLPTGFIEPADLASLNLNVYDGTGTLLTEGAGNDYSVIGGDFFRAGIDFHNTSLGGNTAVSGSDVFIITYQLQLDGETAIDADSVSAGSLQENIATVDFFTGQDDGTTNWTEVTGEPTDTATVTIADPSVEKHLISTEISDGTNANNEGVIGEEATYQVIITMPEGETSIASLVDTLDAGLTFIELTSVSVSDPASITTDIGDGTFNLANIRNHTATSGQNVTFDLGTITNINNNNGTAETITLEYTVFVNNTAGNQNTAPTVLDNSVVVNFTADGVDQVSNAADAEDITVIEPELEVLKEVEVGGDGNAGGDAGDLVTYIITIQHSAASETDAFDVTFADQIPVEIDLTGPGAGITAVTDSAGFLGTGDFTLTGQNLTLNGDIDMPEARIITITVTGTLVAGVTPAQTITNNASVQWESLGGTDSDTGLPYHQDGTTNERTGGPATVDNYSDGGSATITITSVTVAKSLIDTEISDDVINPDLIDEVGINERLEAIIGEEATYEVVITVPESIMDGATLVDTLDAGLIIQRIDVVTPTGDLTSSVALDDVGVTYTTAGTGATGDPQTVTFILGDMSNGSNDGGAETLTIRYTVLVLNDDGSNNDGDTLNNSAQFNYTGGSSNVDSAEEITIIEPVISTVKTINGIADPGEATVEVGAILTYTVVLTNTGNASAYEVTAVDTLAPGTRYYTDGAHTPSADVGGVTITDNGATISITSGTDGWDLAEDASVTITYYALVGADYFDQTYGTTPANLINTVDADWSSNDNSISLTNSGLDRVYDDGVNGHNYAVDGDQDDDPAAFNISYNGSFGDMVFFDSLGDGGVFNSAEGDVGIDGVTVTLQATVDGVTHTWTEVTGNGPGGVTGYYYFDNLPIFDDYTITVDYSGAQGGTDLDGTHGYLPTYDLDQGINGLNNEVTGLEITTANPTLHGADIDFGYTGQNSVGDTVWFDADNDGLQDVNEGGLNGLTVTLRADIDGDGILEYEATTITQRVGGLDGQYSFDHLPGGDYEIEVTPLEDSVQTYDLDDGLGATNNQADFSLGATENRDNVDFGYRGTASIGDFVWFDVNADADPNDGVNSGLAYVDLTIEGDFDGDGNIDYTETVQTAADGSYLFDHLMGGTYTITVDDSTLPSGASNWTQTFDLDDAAPMALDDTATGIILASDQDRTDVDFGYTGTGSLGDTVWYDINANGVQDGAERGIEGVEVTITADVDGDGINEYTASAITDSNGFYSFINLPAAAYETTVNTATLPDGQEQTFDKDDDLTPFATPDSDTTILAIGADIDDVDFGYRGTGSIGDFLWYDEDADGTQNEGASSGMGGIRVTISGDIDGDNVVDYSHETTTAADGSYLFDNLFAGAYTITVNDSDLPDGMVQTFDLDDGIGPVFSTAHAAAVTLLAGADRRDVDFGYTGTGSIGDTVFFDALGDGGVFNAGDGDVGISGVDVTLTADFDGDGIAEYNETVRTDADGNYLFNNLAAFDSYVITVDPATSGGTNPTDLTATGFSQTYDLDEGITDLDHTATSINLTAGQNRTDIDFGYTGQNSVGDTIWYDVNDNGTQDANEEGINGLTVTLTADIDGDGIYEYTAITTTQNIGGLDGQYGFTQLPAGEYRITVASPADSEQTWDFDDGLAASDDMAAFSLNADEDNFDIDFGYRGTGSIGDFVWYDANADGTQNEAITSGLAGVELTLTGDIDGDGTVDYTVTTITADDGSYLFEHLLGGTYTISLGNSTLPSGASNWNQTFDRDEGTLPTALDDTATAIVLADGEERDDIDFGYAGTGSLGDRVWYDLDADGVQDAGELGMAGVEVQITADVDGDGTNEYVTSVVTDANGNYTFDNLPAAEYTITINPFTLPDGAVASYDFDSATVTPNGTSQYLLAEGENTDLVDFGYTGAGSIGDTVWNDMDGDGIQDSGEEGYSGVTVTLTGDFDGDGDAHDTITTVTDASGNYLFDDLFFGDYTVTVDETALPPGTNPTHDLDGIGTPNISVVTLDDSNPNRDDVDFGYNSQGTIGDTVWYDADGDGIQDPDEAGLANITVTLNGPGGQVVVSTDENGNYLFDQLAAGDYTITLSGLPAGMNQTADPDGGNDNMASVSLTAGETNLDQDFGYTGTGSIGDTIWSDADGDGTDNGGTEDGIAGVTVTLTGDVDNDGVDDILTTSTDSSGHYSFDNLPVGDYTIVVDETTLPPGMNQTFDPEGAVDGSADVSLGGSEPMVVDTIDFGYQQTGTIGDRIWFDVNGDGIQDPDESGLANVTVTLDGPGGTVMATTDANGNYLFDNLVAGDYTITVSGLPAGMAQTGDPDGVLDNVSALTLGAGEVNLDQDFAYTGTGSIGDTIWNDANGDGTDNGGTESGIAGVVVTLTGDLDNDGVADDVLTTTTDADGHYSFDQLPEGDYTIVVDESTLPPGMNQTFDPEGAVDGSADVTLPAGTDINTIDFGYQQTSTIGDTIWYDMDADGVQDPDELGLVNINVTLIGDLDGDGVADDTLTTSTDTNGNYVFEDLPVGEYTITVDPASLPGGMEQTYDLDGLGTPNTATVIIGANESNLDVDFGYTGTGTIGDTLWLDVDGDGLEDAGEPGLGGVSVTLTGDLDNDGEIDDTITVVTDQNGHYSFPNLPAGNYIIEVDPATLPDGMDQTGDPDGTLDNITEVSLAPGEINTIQDFGYTGTGSIGDTIWLDSNRNGVLDGSESGIAGVSVLLTADFDGNGTVDFTTAVITDANGQYLFSNLPAGSYSISIDPATLPGGLEQTFDPDGLLNFQTTFSLGAGENNMDQDFGFARPIINPTVVASVGPPVVSSTPSVGPVPSDVALMFKFNHSAIDDDEAFGVGDREPDETFMPPPIPVSPVYTGHAEPGTTVTLMLFDAMGNTMGYQTVMADSGGNWLVNFTASLLYDMPHSMAIGQTASLYNESSPGLFNLRSYFNPTMTGLIFSSTKLDLQSITAYEASSIFESMHNGHNALFNLGWNDSSGYEFLSPSINPAKHSR